MNVCKEHAVCALQHRKGGKVILSGIYRTFLGKRQQQKIWIVDGDKVCEQLFGDFIMGGNDQRYRFNPPDDIWIDNRLGVEELEYTIAHELIERRYMREYGWTYDRAHDEGGLEVERKMRKRDIRAAALKGAIYRSYFGKRRGVSIWIVDGPRVRKEFEPDFAFGIHDLKAKFVPEGEIWLDSAMGVEAAYYSLQHQLIERALMAAGMKRGNAYERAQREVHIERVRQAKLVLRHEARLPAVRFGVRERGVKPK